MHHAKRRYYTHRESLSPPLRRLLSRAQVGLFERGKAVFALATTDPGMVTDASGKAQMRGGVKMDLGGQAVEMTLSPELKTGGKQFTVSAVADRKSGLKRKEKRAKVQPTSSPPNAPLRQIFCIVACSSIPVLTLPIPWQRASVYASASVYSASFTLETTPKRPEEEARIRAGIESSPMLQVLSDEQKSDLVGAFELQRYATGSVVIQQGDEGNHFFMVDSGVFSVFKTAPGIPPDKVLFTYPVGGCFGELALLWTAPRAATIKCMEAGACWRIERPAFKHVVQKEGSATLATSGLFLQSVSLLSELTLEQRTELAGRMDEMCEPPRRPSLNRAAARSSCP